MRNDHRINPIRKRKRPWCAVAYQGRFIVI